MQDAARKAGRNKFLLLLAVFAVPIVASYVAYYVGPPKVGTANYGELIGPVALPEDLMLARADGSPLPLKALRGKWILLYAGGGACDTVCQTRLYAMRQAHTMQGREQDRVLRVWLLTDATEVDPELQRTYAGTLAARDPAGALRARLPVRTTLHDHLYLIDPLGEVMMRYSGELDIKRLAKDLGRLLKASALGSRLPVQP